MTNKIFNKFLIGVLFLLGIILIPTFKADATIPVTVKVDGSTSGKTITYGTTVLISWEAPLATSCNSGGHGTLNTGSFYVTPTSTTTYTVTCTGPAPVPINVSVGQGACDSNTLNVSWTAVSGATSYTVYDSSVAVGTSTTNSYVHRALIPDTSHSYSVTATDSGGTSAKSASVQAIAPSQCTGYCVYTWETPPYEPTRYCARWDNRDSCINSGSGCIWVYSAVQ